MSALVGGVVGALVVYFSDKKRREKIVNKFHDLIEEGEKKGNELKDDVDKTIKSGRKTLAHKLREVEKRVAQS